MDHSRARRRRGGRSAGSANDGRRRPDSSLGTHVSDGDATIWGTVENAQDTAPHQRFADALLAETGFDVRGQVFDQFVEAHVVRASSVEVIDDHLDITVWREGSTERVVRKH